MTNFLKLQVEMDFPEENYLTYHHKPFMNIQITIIYVNPKT